MFQSLNGLVELRRRIPPGVPRFASLQVDVTKTPMTAGETVSLEPALTEMLTQHFHNAAVRGQMIVLRDRRLHPRPVGGFEEGGKTIGGGLVRSHHPEVL